MKLPRFGIWSIPYLFALITVSAYGLLLGQTGFYWDDWPFAWIAKFLGPREFFPAFAPFRPFLAPIFFVTTSLVPIVPIYWQIFALIIRFAIGLAAWWMFKQLWPNRPHTALYAALLILVFPGYSQHWVALTHINQELIPFLFYLISFGFTFKALRSEKPLYPTLLAVLFQILGIFPTEYFFGMEGLRFCLLFFTFQDGFKERLIKTVKHGWSHLIVWILNAAWLIYYYKFGAYNSYEVTASQSLNLSNLFMDMLDSIWKAGFYIWGQVLVLIFSSIHAPASLLSLGLIIVSFILLTLYLLNLSLQTWENENEQYLFTVGLLITGLFGILLGRLPSWAAGLPLTLQSSYDRFMVSMMLGGSLFILGLFEWLFGKSRYKVYIFSLIIALGIGQQFFNANIFRRDWSNQQEIYWQLAWRIPVLKPNTAILTSQMPIDYETDMSFTAPINWMYAPNFQRAALPYLMLYTEKRLSGSALPEMKPDHEITFNYRTMTFHGNTSQVIVIFMPSNGCLRVLDPALGDAITYSKQSRYLVDAIPLSDPALAISTSNQQAEPAFFSEPKPEWCYYYAKAELAQQQKDWQQIIKLEKEATSKGYAPNDPFEWLPFIEANALTDNFADAKKLSNAAFAEDRSIRKGLCETWRRIQEQSVSNSQVKDTANKLLLQFQCIQ